MKTGRDRYMTVTNKRVIDPFGDFVPDLEEITYSLARIVRWNGYTPMPYTVGMHVLHCAYAAVIHHGLRDPNILLHIALHDASEAYTGDIIKPIKLECLAVMQLEEDLQSKLYDSLNIPEPTRDQYKLVKIIDRNTVVTEHKGFFPGRDCPVEGDYYPDDLVEVFESMRPNTIETALTTLIVSLIGACKAGETEYSVPGSGEEQNVGTCLRNIFTVMGATHSSGLV